MTRCFVNQKFAVVFGLFAAAALWSCGGGSNEETSVFAVVNNGPAVVRPDQVQIDVYKGQGGAPESLVRAAAAGTGARLGDLVIYPPLGLGSLRIAAFGKLAGEVVSSGQIDVAIEEGKQVSVQIVLLAGLPMGDGGVLPADAGSPPDAPYIDANDVVSPGSDAGASDVSAPQTDTLVVQKKTTGQACMQGTECESGSCLQQVCCDKACDGICNSCKAAGQPVGQCTPVADGTKCGEPMCESARVLIPYACAAGVCNEQPPLTCMKKCNRETLTCD